MTLVHASWDHHSDLDNELAYCAGMADQPLAALIKDLKQRGLLDSTLLVFAGEFGRTPLAENRGGILPDQPGRDHHPFAFSVWMAGGGFKGGLTYGQTDEIGWGVVRQARPHQRPARHDPASVRLRPPPPRRQLQGPQRAADRSRRESCQRPAGVAGAGMPKDENQMSTE